MTVGMRRSSQLWTKKGTVLLHYLIHRFIFVYSPFSIWSYSINKMYLRVLYWTRVCHTFHFMTRNKDKGKKKMVSACGKISGRAFLSEYNTAGKIWELWPLEEAETSRVCWCEAGSGETKCPWKCNVPLNSMKADTAVKRGFCCKPISKIKRIKHINAKTPIRKTLPCWCTVTVMSPSVSEPIVLKLKKRKKKGFFFNVRF